MNGFICGVFGSNQDQKSIFLNSIAKKSEVEGIIVYHREESGIRFSFLDDTQFPEKIQGYSKIASLSDHACYLFPRSGKLAAPDGELAVLMDAYELSGTIELIDSPLEREVIQSNLKGLSIADYPLDTRDSKSSRIDLSGINASSNFPKNHTIIYIDRAFSVKGVGIVVLGFVLSGRVSIHDKMRLIPSIGPTKYAEIKGIQINDEDYDESERGIRVGLSLKGVELKDLSKTRWLDDGTFALSSNVELKLKQSPYYKQSLVNRDLHLQIPGELLVGKLRESVNHESTLATFQIDIPIWEGMKVGLLDLNAKALRVAGSGTVTK